MNRRNFTPETKTLTPSLPSIMVKVVHFVSLTEMFVVTTENYQNWTNLTKRCKIIGHDQPIVTNVEINAIYLVMYNNEWHRARVISTEHQKVYLCHLIDYGENVKLRSSEMREIREDLTENQDFLIKCALFDIVFVEDTVKVELFLDCLLME